jgi:hypothetical protein
VEIDTMRRRLMSLLTALVVPLAFATPTHAATGDVLRSITVTPTPSCSSGITVGIAFDGKELLVSCTGDNVITRVDPSDGTNLGSYTISGLDGIPAGVPGSDNSIGAMSWDASVPNGQLWIATANGSENVYRIPGTTLNKTLGTGTALPAFHHALNGSQPGGGGPNPIIDGISFDGTGAVPTIWLSPDVSYTVFQYTEAGVVLNQDDVQGKLGTCFYGPCGNSGVVVADDKTLYLANDGGSQIYSGDKPLIAATSLFATVSGFRLEDMECDNVDFAPKGALWSKDAFDYILRAFEVPAGQCAQGGVKSVATTVTLSPATATNDVGTNHTVTATVLDQFGNPMGGVNVFFTVTRTPPVAVTNTGNCTTTLPSGSCTFTYPGPILPAADVIKGCANSASGPPCGTATKEWVLPVSNPLCTIDITNGGWMVANNGDKVNFGGTVHTDQAGAPSGQEQYSDKPANLDVHSIDIKAVTCSSNLETADIFGDATINGSGTFVFRIEVSDPDSSSGADTYWITLSNGYDSGKHDLGGGTIEIHNT